MTDHQRQPRTKMNEALHGLPHIIQYRRKDEATFDPWHSMAAFDSILAAERYYAAQSSEVWEYRLIEIAADND